MSATLDACTLIALLTPDHVHHRSAVATLDTLIGGDLWVHPLNLAEVLVPHARRDGGIADRTDGITDQLAGMGVQVWDQSDTSHAVDLACVRAELRVKMPDACAVTTAWETGTPLLTFDARLAGAVTRGTLPVSLVAPL